MRILSLFDGISCGRLALERAGIPVTTYFASEIDPFANYIARKRWPANIPLGNIQRWRDWKLPWGKIDLVIGGSPCQGFSGAGAGLGFEDPRSRLFFDYADIVRHVREANPKAHYLLENVRMRAAWMDRITENLPDCPVPLLVNSEVLSAQLRLRAYWSSWTMQAPVKTRDILLQEMIEPGWWTDREKSLCLTARYFKGTNFKGYFFRKRDQIVFANGYRAPDGMTIHDTNLHMRAARGRWRMLTPEEAERVQTLPTGYTALVPPRERYKVIGNGWTVDVVAALLRQGPFPRWDPRVTPRKRTRSKIIPENVK